MTDQPEQDRPVESIEEMPAAPEADQGTRDADAPTWSAPTEGHTQPPLPHVPDAAVPGAAETADGATPVPAVGGATGTEPAAELAAVVAPAGSDVTADRVVVNQGGANRITAHEVTIHQGGAAVIRGDIVKVDQGGAAVVIGRRIELRGGGGFLLIARRVEGDVRVAFDWRALTALFVGIVAVVVARGRR